MLYTRRKFYQYVLGFYGPGGVYDMNATLEQVKAATKTLYARFGKANIDHDSLDRERVRDILIELHGLKFPAAPNA